MATLNRPHASLTVFMIFLTVLLAVPPLIATAQPDHRHPFDGDAVLDLPAMTLTPADLTTAGLQRYRLNFGQLHAFDETAALIAEDQDLSEQDAHELLDEAGFVLWYENGLYLRPDEDDPQGDVTGIVRSYVLQFTDEDGAADAWDWLEDESEDDGAEDLSNVEQFGDDSEATRYRDDAGGAIDLSFRLGAVHAGVMVQDRTGGSPALEDVEALAALLIERIESVIDDGGPGLSAQALRLTGAGVEASVDNYLLMDGEAIHFYYETRTDRRDREDQAEERGQTDAYEVWQLLSALGSGLEDDVWFFARVGRFVDDDAASAWLAGIEDRVESNEAFAGFEIDEDAPDVGDESVTYTVNQAERPIAYRGMLIRLDDLVAELTIQGPEIPGLDAMEELAALQVGCLDDGGCFEPVAVPDAVTSYIDELAGPDGDDDGNDGSDDQGSPEAVTVFRGGPAHTGVQPGPGPKGDLRVRWELELLPTEDYVTHPVSPSLQNGVLYVLRHDGLHAIDAESGEELWFVEAAANMDSTPVLGGNAVYFTAYDGIFALDASSGEILWQNDDQGANEVDPAVSEGRLYVMMQNGELVALNGESGEELWRVLTGSGASPTVVNGVVYVAGYIYEGGPEDGHVFWALDAASGEELWHIGMETGLSSPPAVTGGVIYGGGENGTLYALDAETGDELWTYAGELTEGSGRVPVPAVADGEVYYGSLDGNFVALEAESGEIIWETNVGDYVLFPVVADGAVYLFPIASLLILDAETGEARATLDELGEIESGGGGGFFSTTEFIRTSPLVVDGVIYVVLENGVLAIEGSD